MRSNSTTREPGDLVGYALGQRGRHVFSDDTDLWPRIQRAVVIEGQTNRRTGLAVHSKVHVALIALLCVAVVTTGVAVASPVLRHAFQSAIPNLHHAGDAMNQFGRPVAIQPRPKFALFYPRSFPGGLAVSGTGQLFPGGGSVSVGGAATGCSVLANCASARSPFAASGKLSGLPTLLDAFSQASIDVVWFGRAGIPPDRRFIQIAEWSAKEGSIKTISRDTVAGAKHAALLFLTKGATRIVIETNMGVAEAHRIASSLEPLNLRNR